MGRRGVEREQFQVADPVPVPGEYGAAGVVAEGEEFEAAVLAFGDDAGGVQVAARAEVGGGRAAYSRPASLRSQSVPADGEKPPTQGSPSATGKAQVTAESSVRTTRASRRPRGPRYTRARRPSRLRSHTRWLAAPRSLNSRTGAALPSGSTRYADRARSAGSRPEPDRTPPSAGPSRPPAGSSRTARPSRPAHCGACSVPGGPGVSAWYRSGCPGGADSVTVTAIADPSCCQQPSRAEVPDSPPASRCRPLPSGRTHSTRVSSPPPGAVV
ncbi:hypothetical protein SALBM217S_05993 [Streptomyces griseoloalbus]